MRYQKFVAVTRTVGGTYASENKVGEYARSSFTRSSPKRTTGVVFEPL
jgi:hypothetical protein